MKINRFLYFYLILMMPVFGADSGIRDGDETLLSAASAAATSALVEVGEGFGLAEDEPTKPLDSSPKTVLTFGTFDLFHIGHLNILKRAKELACGGRLIVGVSTDEFSYRRKSRFPVFKEEERVEIVKSSRFVDEVFYETDYDQKPTFIDQYGAQLLVLGDDWSGKFDGIHPTCKIIYLPRTEGVSSTDLLRRIREE